MGSAGAEEAQRNKAGVVLRAGVLGSLCWVAQVGFLLTCAWGLLDGTARRTCYHGTLHGGAGARAHSLTSHEFEACCAMLCPLCRLTKKSKGFALIQFASPEDAVQASRVVD